MQTLLQIVALDQTRHLRPFSGSVRKTKERTVYRGFCFLILTRVWPKVVPKLFSEQLYCSLLSSNEGGAKKQDMAVYTAVDLLYCCKNLYY